MRGHFGIHTGKHSVGARPCHLHHLGGQCRLERAAKMRPRVAAVVQIEVNRYYVAVDMVNERAPHGHRHQLGNHSSHTMEYNLAQKLSLAAAEYFGTLLYCDIIESRKGIHALEYAA